MTIGTEANKSSAEAAKVAQDALRRYMNESVSATRTYWTVWTAATQAAMRTAFELQNASIKASRAVVDASVQANASWYDQATDSVRKSQDAAAKLMTSGFEMVESTMPGMRT